MKYSIHNSNGSGRCPRGYLPSEPRGRRPGIPCRKMPELIVRRLINDLPSGRRREVEKHLEQCIQCRIKSLALEIAAEINTPDPETT